MRHAGGSENIPIGALNRVLITHHQRSQHTCQLAVINPLKYGFTRGLAGAFDRFCP
jgi:hypothetical protein